MGNISDIPAWSTVTVAFKVTVNKDIGAATIKNQATATDGVNSYESDWVTNYTVKDEVEKSVFNESAPSVSINGHSVKYGDVLVYTIVYKNTSSETVAVTITDIVPKYTTYVDGSADNGGVYADGEIVWNLDVGPRETATVSFKVEVNYDVSGSITNTAIVLAGKNVYTTNEVATPIDTPDVPSIPETGERTDLGLLFALLFVSGGGLITVSIYNKKKKQAETK